MADNPLHMLPESLRTMVLNYANGLGGPDFLVPGLAKTVESCRIEVAGLEERLRPYNEATEVTELPEFAAARAEQRASIEVLLAKSRSDLEAYALAFDLVSKAPS